jgi:Xaa-Pro aminopeptidase
MKQKRVSMSELETKLNQLRQLMEQKSLDAVFLHRVSSFAWATGGAASFINTAVVTGEASLLITKDARYLITNNIEAPHYDKEEQLKEQGWDFQVGKWYEASDTYARLTKGLKVGADVAMPGASDISAEILTMRMNLGAEEQQRFREVARLNAEAMDIAVRAARPGMTENEIAAVLSKESRIRGLVPIVNLIATDERIYNFRHPLPADDKKMDKYAMLVLCGRKYGLVCSITRLIHYGPLPEELQKKQRAVAEIDAKMIAATRPGKTLNQVFARTQQAYAEAGFPGEWELHHQGGPAGYEPRETIANPQATARVEAGQTYAWNPSITGVKSEDTVLITDDGCEVLTEIAGWPSVEVEVDGMKLRRPLVLEV